MKKILTIILILTTALATFAGPCAFKLAEDKFSGASAIDEWRNVGSGVLYTPFWQETTPNAPGYVALLFVYIGNDWLFLESTKFLIGGKDIVTPETTQIPRKVLSDARVSEGLVVTGDAFIAALAAQTTPVDVRLSGESSADIILSPHLLEDLRCFLHKADSTVGCRQR